MSSGRRSLSSGGKRLRMDYSEQMDTDAGPSSGGGGSRYGETYGGASSSGSYGQQEEPESYDPMALYKQQQQEMLRQV